MTYFSLNHLTHYSRLDRAQALPKPKPTTTQGTPPGKVRLGREPPWQSGSKGASYLAGDAVEPVAQRTLEAVDVVGDKAPAVAI